MSKKDTVTQLVKLIADGQFHSGEALGNQLGISRAAIGKHIHSLTELGLDIFKVVGKGYKLSRPLTLLDVDQITAELTSNASLEVLSVIDSTNQYIKGRIEHISSGFTCLAEAQTAGRGRHGRAWISPFGASLYLSTYWRFADGYQAAAGLSLAVGVALASALKQFAGVDIALKWPNDVYLDGKKLAGVLIEVEGQFGAACDCVIGIGLNVNLPTDIADIGQPFTDLSHAVDEPINRNTLSAYLINELIDTLKKFERSGLVEFVEQWRQLDFYANKAIKLISGDHTITGIGRGISDNGGLRVESDGAIKTYYGGEISVRAAD